MGKRWPLMRVRRGARRTRYERDEVLQILDAGLIAHVGVTTPDGPLAEASAKVRTGDPIDEPEDIAGPWWAGVVPVSTRFEPPVASMAEHPIDTLATAGVSIGISTDQRAITDTTLTQEMRRLVDAFGWERSVLLRRQLDALEAAFVTEPERDRFRERLVESWA